MRKSIFVGGIVASIAMAMMEMVYEGLFGAGFWSAPIFIAATILRDLQSIAAPGFSLVPVVVGMMGHMMNSIILALIFVAVVYPSSRTRAAASIAGALFGVAVFIGMWFVILPIIDPVMLNLNPWVFVLAHVLWGGVLGYIVAWGKGAPARIAPEMARA